MSEPVTRPKFLNDLLAEVDGFDENIYPPPYDMEEGDKVIGTIDGWTRKLYALMRYYTRQGKLLQVELEDPGAGDERERRAQELAEAHVKHKVLAEIMWGCMRSEFQCFTCPSVGVRKDWKFVESKEDEDDDPIKAAFIAMLKRSRKQKE